MMLAMNTWDNDAGQKSAARSGALSLTTGGGCAGDDGGGVPLKSHFGETGGGVLDWIQLTETLLFVRPLTTGFRFRQIARTTWLELGWLAGRASTPRGLKSSVVAGQCTMDPATIDCDDGRWWCIVENRGSL